MTSKEIIVRGEKTDPASQVGISEEFVIEQSFKLSANRSLSGEHIVENTPDKIFQLTLEDDTEWIGTMRDLREIHGESPAKKRDTLSSVFEFPDYLHPIKTDRGLLSAIKNKRLDVIRGKLLDKTAEVIGKKLDERLMANPGLFKIDQSFDLQKAAILPREKHLLLIHGTFSSIQGSFDNLAQNIWSQLYDNYQGRTIGFNHFTVSQSPYRNALDLLKALPDEIELDVISTSRGGLVADILARCDFRNDMQGFTEQEIALVSKHDKRYKSQIASELKDINRIVEVKRIKIGKNIRIACPASGTLLLSKRLDHFLNFFLNSIHKALGGKINVIFGALKSFLLQIVKSRHNAKSFPGLWAMVPDSIYQQINNNDFKLANDLICITGDTDIGGGLFQSLKVILTNLYYWTENDFVVDTKAMSRGLYNRNSIYSFHIEGSDVNHFQYFTQKDSIHAIQQSLTNPAEDLTGFKNIQDVESRRGINTILSIIDFKEVQANHVSGAKPIVVLIPGIMGSNIHHKGNRIWFDHKELRKGGIRTFLNIDERGVEALSALGRIYSRFKEYFETDFDVLIYPFDWRKSLSESTRDFDKKMTSLMGFEQPISVVSHSMGGLLVRQWKADCPEKWSSFRQADQSKWIMLGTPWRGSYLIMEVLTGHSKRVKQIDRIDDTQDKLELLEVLNSYPGIFELLPIDQVEFEKRSFWESIVTAVGKEEMIIPDTDVLQKFSEYKKDENLRKISFDDSQIIYYIAGYKNRTTHGYEITENNDLQYLTTSEGDGSVAWSYGIPDDLQQNVYYSDVEHTNLVRKKTVLRAIKDIIISGKTELLHEGKPLASARGGGLHAAEPVIDYYEPLNYFHNLYDTDADDSTQESVLTIDVKVFNGDMKWANYPVMLGHFENDGIVSAERTLDIYLKGKLYERHRMRFYPGKIGEQAIILDKQNYPRGAIIVGLGNKTYLSGYQLAVSVEKAVLKYALFFRDNDMGEENLQYRDGISTLLVGSAYGQLSMLESVRSVLIGIQRANSIISNLQNGLTPIKYVEFVDYYEDNAYQAYKILKGLAGDRSTIQIQLSDFIERGYGAKKRFIRDESRSWWHSLTTIMQLNVDSYGKPYLKFSSYAGSANVSLESVYSNLDLAMYLADELSQNDSWDIEDSKTVFELLIPNKYKDFVRNHRNIEWKMDVHTAQFPWEMFHDFNYGENPTFVESGLIRQLYSSTADINPAIVTENRALVIGDPVYNDPNLPPLNGALEEARMVEKKLTESGVEVNSLLRSDPVTIVKSFYAQEYKILHIASHGIYDPEGKKVGIVIGDGQFLSPGDIRQMTAIPEFVFINCCYSGTVKGEDEVYYRHKHKLAANVGTQFIEMGVKAVVVAGWAVSDSAAMKFASDLYNNLYEGDYFGDAVTKARYRCYVEHPDVNTWGAYQCYGDQYYRLTRHRWRGSGDNDISIAAEFTLELDNILSASKSVVLLNGDGNALNNIRTKTEKLIQRAKELDIYCSEIKEREALIYANLGLYDFAVEKFRNLIISEDADYSIRILDKYNNIRARQLVNRYISHKEDEISTDEFHNELDKIQTDLESVNLLGDTYRRLNSMASTYKRFSLIDGRNRKQHLKKASQLYLKAARSVGFSDRAAIYPMTSYITLQFLSDKSKYRRQFYHDTKIKLTEYLDDWIKKVEAHVPNRSDVWDQLAEIQLKFCQFLIDKANSNTTCKIIQLYKRQIARCFNAKDLIGEIEHLIFVEHMLKKSGKKADQYEMHIKEVIRIREFLEGYN